MQFPGNGLFFGRVDLEIFECLELLIIHFAGELGQERRWLHLCFLIMNLSSIPVPLDTNHPNGYCKGMPSHPKDMYSMNHYHLIEINFIFQLFSAVMMTINPATRFDLRPQTQPSPHLSAWTGALTMKGKAKTAKPIIHRRVELLDKNPRHGVPWRWYQIFPPQKERSSFFFKSGFFSCILTWTYVNLKHKKKANSHNRRDVHLW